MLAILVIASSIAPLAGQIGGTTGAVRPAQHFIVEYSGSEQMLEEATRAVGGTIDRLHASVRLATVSGLSDAEAAALGQMGGVTAVTRDVVFRWLPAAESMVRGTIATASNGPTPQGHNPTGAAFFPLQWDMQIIDADDAWLAGFSSHAGVRVAVIDTGIDPFHVDLAGLVDAGSSIALTPSLNPGGPAWGDDHFHGTHVAGSIVTNGIGTSGVAPHTTLIAVKVLNVLAEGTFADLIAGILHAADVQADVINMSLGEGFPMNAPGAGRLIGALNKAVNYASRRGALVVSAAGNNGVDLTHLGVVTAVPCELSVSLCVSATGPSDSLAAYSNFGRPIHLAAPGGDLTVTGVPATSTVLAPCSTLSLLIPSCGGGGSWLFLEGTSMATAHVSGAAALLDAQFDAGLLGSQLGTRLMRAADDIGKPGADQLYGHGRVNVFRAVTP
jgi:subtilisin family serine protease